MLAPNTLRLSGNFTTLPRAGAGWRGAVNYSGWRQERILQRGPLTSTCRARMKNCGTSLPQLYFLQPIHYHQPEVSPCAPRSFVPFVCSSPPCLSLRVPANGPHPKLRAHRSPWQPQPASHPARNPWWSRRQAHLHLPAKQPAAKTPQLRTKRHRVRPLTTRSSRATHWPTLPNDLTPRSRRCAN